MIPQYRFFLQVGANGAQVAASPVYNGNLALNYEMEQGQRFFRAKLNGKLTFYREDYDTIMAAPFGTVFYLYMEISTDPAGLTFAPYYKSKFTITDCTVNLDDRLITVQPQTTDQYDEVLAGMDNEYNLITLAPAMNGVTISKRPLVQVYVAGSDFLNNYIAGTSWEQSCTANDNKNELGHVYWFGLDTIFCRIEVANAGDITGTYSGKLVKTGTHMEGLDTYEDYDVVLENDAGATDYYFNIDLNVRAAYYEDWWFGTIDLRRRTGSTSVSYSKVTLSSTTFNTGFYKLTGTATVNVWIENTFVMARWLTDAESVTGITLYDIPENDIAGENRNYHKVAPIQAQCCVSTTNTSTTATEYGLVYDFREFNVTRFLGWLSDTGTNIFWGTQTYSVYVNVNPNDSVQITGDARGLCSYVFCSDAFLPTGNDQPYSLCSGASRVTMLPNETKNVTAPSDARYILLSSSLSAQNGSVYITKPVINGAYIGENGGVIPISHTFAYCDYVELPAGIAFKVQNRTLAAASFAIYNRNKQVTRVIKTADVSGQDYITFTLNANERYIRNSYRIGDQCVVWFAQDVTDMNALPNSLLINGNQIDLTDYETQYFPINGDGVYYAEPTHAADEWYRPIAQSNWKNGTSYWFNYVLVFQYLEQQGMTSYLLRNAYPLWSCISVLLSATGSSVTFQGTSAYSEFLYSERNPLSGELVKLFVTPKSNILAGDYSVPAQKAMTTLGQFLDMLRNVYQLYWFIDADNRLRIEHIRWFKNGGSYSGSPTVGIDLTELLEKRNATAWAYGVNEYTYEKEEMPQRYQFEWMDDERIPFKGEAIEILSPAVTEGKVESVSVGNFSSDIDYMLLNPSVFSQDGFALIGATGSGNSWSVPFITYTQAGVRITLQNGYLSFFNLQPTYWVYDLPAKTAKINGIVYSLSYVSRSKQQRVTIPLGASDPDFLKLVKTNMGDGEIRAVSIPLSSRVAQVTLNYDTE